MNHHCFLHEGFIKNLQNHSSLQGKIALVQVGVTAPIMVFSICDQTRDPLDCTPRLVKRLGLPEADHITVIGSDTLEVHLAYCPITPVAGAKYSIPTWAQEDVINLLRPSILSHHPHVRLFTVVIGASVFYGTTSPQLGDMRITLPTPALN